MPLSSGASSSRRLFNGDLRWHYDAKKQSFAVRLLPARLHPQDIEVISTPQDNAMRYLPPAQPQEWKTTLSWNGILPGIAPATKSDEVPLTHDIPACANPRPHHIRTTVTATPRSGSDVRSGESSVSLDCRDF